MNRAAEYDFSKAKPGPVVPKGSARRKVVFMGKVHMTEAEFTRDIRCAIDQVEAGAEIVIERGSRPVAAMKRVNRDAPKISEILSAMEVGGTSGVVDEDFAKDVAEGIPGWNEPWIPPTWS